MAVAWLGLGGLILGVVLAAIAALWTGSQMPFGESVPLGAQMSMEIALGLMAGSFAGTTSAAAVSLLWPFVGAPQRGQRTLALVIVSLLATAFAFVALFLFLPFSQQNLAFLLFIGMAGVGVFAGRASGE